MASLSPTTLRRRITLALAPALAMLGLIVAPATHALANNTQTFTCHYSSHSLPPNTTVALSNGGRATVTVGEFAGYYSGLTVQPGTGPSNAGIEAQCLLLRAGFSPGAIDGQFGPLSQEAAMDFQAQVDSACHGGLVQDGQVGPQTWPWLRFYDVTPIGCGGL